MTATYELLDSGNERRLERFGPHIVDRPAPGAWEPVRDPGGWRSADLTFERGRGWWAARGDVPTTWQIEDGDLQLELRPTPTGQVGLFPEQAPTRAWVRDVIGGLATPPAVLNLFAYSGTMTLSMAVAGASVTHVDGSRPAVAWARRNTDLSGLGDRPIRWIVDDAAGFVGREARRGRRYEGLVIDPPSYGHGAGGGTWRLEEHLPGLLGACTAVTGARPAFVVLSAHTPGFDADRLAEELAVAFRRRPADVDAGDLGVRAANGAHLRLGAYARIIGA